MSHAVNYCSCSARVPQHPSNHTLRMYSPKATQCVPTLWTINAYLWTHAAHAMSPGTCPHISVCLYQPTSR
jgi:hypothetical protein